MFYNKSFGFKSWALGRFELLVLLVYPVYFCCRSNNLNEKVFNEEIHSRLIASFLLGLHIMKVLKRGNKLKKTYQKMRKVMADYVSLYTSL